MKEEKNQNTKHSVSLDNDSLFLSKSQSIIFSVPPANKTLTTFPRQMKSPGNSNMLHTFGKYIYMISEQPKITKLNCIKCDKGNRPVSLIFSFNIKTLRITSSNIF